MRALRLLIGHRGVGKTTLLKRLAAHSPEAARFMDLDHEIERRTQRTITELFSDGEVAFRSLEARILGDINAEAEQNFKATGQCTWVAVGAGLERPPEGAYIVWIRRATDKAGRVFLNRPRLSNLESPFDEYMRLFTEREKRYVDWADEFLELPEGYSGGLEDFLIGKPVHLPGLLTLEAREAARWSDYWSRREAWHPRQIELRDDLLTDRQMEEVIKDLPSEQILFSRRVYKEKNLPGIRTDHALELGPSTEASILSLHNRQQSFTETLKVFEFQPTTSLRKLAVEVRTFAELIEGHRWWLTEPQRRAFLPRSKDGRWRWYRALFGPRMPLHFIREGDGAAADQPTLAETLLQAPLRGAFAAVLGSPVIQSRSPIEHHPFFATREMPFVAIDVKENEIEAAWPVLCELGLTHAAVTAPLKKWAARVAPPKKSAAPEAPRAGHDVANTLWFQNGKWHSANTDALALAALARERQDWGEVWVWGAGAMSANLQAVFPGARIISARQGLESATNKSPDTLIWATSRGREFKWPDFNLKPRRVFDLNYTDDSPGLEWAARAAVSYESGLPLFKLQAEEQRRLWSST